MNFKLIMLCLRINVVMMFVIVNLLHTVFSPYNNEYNFNNLQYSSSSYNVENVPKYNVENNPRHNQGKLYISAKLLVQIE